MLDRIWNGFFAIFLKMSGEDLYPQTPADEFSQAIFSGNVSEVTRLLENGRSANEKDHNVNPVLFVAIESGSISVVELLLKNGADVNAMGQQGFTPLHLAVENTVDENGNDYVLADEEELDIVACLLKAGADVNLLNEMGVSAIDIAEEYGFDQIILLLRSYA